MFKMLRSLYNTLLATQNLTFVAGRIVQRAQPTVNQHAKSLHFSNHNLSDDDFPHPKKGRTVRETKARQEKLNLKPVSAELKRAAVNVARSLPGDWTRTAEELVSRLQLHLSPDAKSEATEPEENNKSLLRTIEIKKSTEFQRRQQREQLKDPSTKVEKDFKEDDLYSTRHIRNETSSRRVARVARRELDYRDMFKMPRLGIFDADKLKSESDKQLVSKEPDDLWRRFEAENVRRALGAVPRNAFEEMIQWTKQGKLWKFPIDNEADMLEERKYRFHDHIFLEKHLSEFPDKGPIRKFMELVVLGLSMNSWISVPEKVEHIRWFAEYFRKKQDVLEASIGEQGRMREDGEKLE